MPKFSRVTAGITKITNRGRCLFGHQVGEEFVFTEMGCDRPLCLYAQQALLPAVIALLHAGSFPWKKRRRHCSHPGNSYPGRGQVIFKLEAQ